MERKRIGYCRELARKLVKKYDFVGPPIDVVRIAKEEGFKIHFIKGEPDQFSGILNRKLKGMGINADHPQVRQRFSIAHEMGHFCLDHPQEEDLGTEDERVAWKIVEDEANEFAGELLVPRDLLKTETKKHHALPADKRVADLVRVFEVSKHVLVIQLSKHNLLMRL